MNKRYLSFLFGMGLSVLSMNAAIIKVAVNNPTPKTKVILKFLDSEKKEFAVDANGNGMIDLKNFTPQYVTLQYGNSTRTVYLDPKADLSMSFEGKRMWKAISFTGAGAAVNNYLNSGKLKQAYYEESKLGEKAYIKTADSLYHANLKVLSSTKLPASFVKVEKNRLKYFSYANFPLYTMFHAYMNKVENYQVSENYYSRLKGLVDINPDFLAFAEYREFIINAISTLGLHGSSYNDMLDLLKVQLKYVKENISNPTVREYLVSTVTYNYVKRNGLDHAELAIEAFNTYVKDAKMKSKFNEVYNSWKKISVGQSSPVFSCEDINGKTVALSQLKGKYIYIDIWATWCAPCRGELPHLKKLEEQYRGKDIEFVSLSCDQNKSAWQKMVAKENLKGVQLYLGTGSKFMNDYMVSGIPRFILLDKDGKIISANMSRPSDPATAQKFNELLGL